MVHVEFGSTSCCDSALAGGQDCLSSEDARDSTNFVVSLLGFWEGPAEINRYSRPGFKGNFRKFGVPVPFVCPNFMFLTQITGGHVVVDGLFHVGPVEVPSDE